MQLTVGRTRALAVSILMGLLVLTAFAQTPARPSPPQGTAAVNENDPDRRQGLEFYQQHKMREAADLLEKVVAKYPQDKFAHLVFGAALAYRAELQTDLESRKADRLRARKESNAGQGTGRRLRSWTYHAGDRPGRWPGSYLFRPQRGGCRHAARRRCLCPARF